MMNKAKRILKKDRYGLIRSCIALCLLLVLFAGLLLHLQTENEISRRAARAASETLRVSAHFEQLVADSLQMLEDTASRLDRGDIGEPEALALLSDYENFSHAALENADGLLDKYKLIPQKGGLQLRSTLKSGHELTAILSSDIVEGILAAAMNGQCSYMLYNASTGACLFNTACADTDSFYQLLSNLNEDAAMQVIHSGMHSSVQVVRTKMNNQAVYITSNDGTQSTCGISLVIADNLLASDSSASFIPVAIAVGPMLLLIALVITFHAAAQKRIRNSNRNAARALDMGEQMVDIAAHDAHITILVIGMGREGVIACHDGLGLTDASNRIRSISDLETICAMEGGEMDRVYECMSKLTAANTTAEITVRCYTANREDRSLRISFHASGSDDKNILCSICDCTHSQAAQYRADQESDYIANARRRASSIWQVNVSRNRWHALHLRKNDPLQKLATKPDAWRDYSSDLSGPLSDYIHPADYPNYAEAMSIPGIASAFRAGATDFNREYRVQAGEGGAYEWHRLHVRLWTEPVSNDIIANFYIYNVDAKKNAELERGERKRVLHQALMALGGIYSGLYYVDLDNDLCYTARSLGGHLADQLSLPYKATFDKYIDNVVHPNDRDAIRSMLSAYVLKRSMTEGSHFQKKDYRWNVSDEDYGNAQILVQPARFENGSVKEIVLAIRYIDHETK